MNKGPIYTISKKEFKNIINESNSIAEVLSKLGYSKVGTAYYAFHKRVKADKISLVGLKKRTKLLHKKHLKKSSEDRSINIDLLLTRNSNCSRSMLKKKLLKAELLENKCSVCKIDEWSDKPLSMHLDHINGINNDNRLENLRMLCPNCHSQTPTYCGRNVTRPEPKRCKDCNEKITSRAKACISCENKRRSRHTKILWPKTSVLIKMIEKSSYLVVAKKLGVSDNAIRKRLKNHPKD